MLRNVPLPNGKFMYARPTCALLREAGCIGPSENVSVPLGRVLNRCAAPGDGPNRASSLKARRRSRSKGSGLGAHQSRLEPGGRRLRGRHQAKVLSRGRFLPPPRKMNTACVCVWREATLLLGFCGWLRSEHGAKQTLVVGYLGYERLYTRGGLVRVRGPHRSRTMTKPLIWTIF